MSVSTIADIGTICSSFSDEYFDLYKILDPDIHIVVDIGSNIGQFTNAIKYWYPDAEVY